MYIVSYLLVVGRDEVFSVLSSDPDAVVISKVLGGE